MLNSGPRWDWNGLKEEVAQYGVRNSLLVALMPTASTSQILEITNALNLILKICIPAGSSFRGIYCCQQVPDEGHC